MRIGIWVYKNTIAEREIGYYLGSVIEIFIN